MCRLLKPVSHHVNLFAPKHLDKIAIQEAISKSASVELLKCDWSIMTIEDKL